MVTVTLDPATTDPTLIIALAACVDRRTVQELGRMLSLIGTIDQIMDFVREHPDEICEEIVEAVLSDGGGFDIVDLARLADVDRKVCMDAVIAARDAEAAEYAALTVARTHDEVLRLQQVVLDSGAPHLAYRFAREVPGADIDVLYAVLENAGDYWTSRFPKPAPALACAA